ncbi:circadian clock-controlled protein-like [Photinus pyralis]|uniref:circadian clock-controlled protein-like n=1 Tax=Photinus pyralis TaxID=7054 RepID=UPI00126771E9|nr:circadian clock-controlled protein-like [Photinus pyralis]
MKRVLLLFSTCYFVGALDLPSEWSKCKRSDPNPLNDCVKNALNVILPTLIKGIPALKMDHVLPLKVEEMSIEEGSGPVKVVQHYKNVEFRNIEAATTESVDATFNDDDFKLVLKLFGEDVTLFADYDFDGFILFLPMVGKGKATISTKNITVTVRMVGDVPTVKNDRYAKLNSIEVTLEPKGAQIEFTNLFEGNEQLGAEMNHILTMEWEALFHDVKHGYEEAVGQAIKFTIDQLFTKVPYNNLFLV